MYASLSDEMSLAHFCSYFFATFLQLFLQLWSLVVVMYFYRRLHIIYRLLHGAHYEVCSFSLQPLVICALPYTLPL